MSFRRPLKDTWTTAQILFVFLNVLKRHLGADPIPFCLFDGF
ncbi:hypothetical protein SB48_HM08orf06097 [Heyndrickxia coagulans]|uniref:Uncharacterized protein n=1 Tax=Heyndrickxia coagulans TaxID=1398 RepID=A0AAN0WDG1_HEYCO|nr:hypothetical protein SB48_HM08orf06097 [Heyndrickxia coagulans]